MRKNVFGRHFKRDANERKALFKSLISALIMNGRIKTTEEKAKAIKADAEKLITKAKEGAAKKRFLQAKLLRGADDKLISEIAPKFSKRKGGYTRIVKLGRRMSDNAKMALIEFVEGEETVKKATEGKTEESKKIAVGETQNNKEPRKKRSSAKK